LLLMDEPFASVDAQTRHDLEDLVLKVHASFGITVVFVTHDIDESVYLGDRIIVLRHRPTGVKEIIDVPLARPRDQLETKATPEFQELRARVFTLIKSERMEHGDVEDTSSPAPAA
jgi:NitT/TauT family transport system ATP-binding protein